MSAAPRAKFDSLVKTFYSTVKQRGSDGYPRTDYGSGVTNLTQLTAKEYSGVVFVTAILLMTQSGLEVANKAIGYELDGEKHTKAENFRYLFEMLLCFERWCKRHTYWDLSNKEAKGHAQAAIITMLDTIKHIAARTEGYTWKLPKFHELLHLTWYMERFGSPRHYDAGIGESHHKVWAKWASKTAQERYGTFDEQTMTRLHEINILHRALEEFKDLPPSVMPDGFLRYLDVADADPEDEEEEDNVNPTSTMDESNVGASIFELHEESGRLALYWTRHKKLYSNMDQFALKDLQGRYFKAGGFPKYKGFQIVSQYTNDKGVTYRAHPDFRSRPWYDWVTIEWLTGDDINQKTPPLPAKIMALVSYDDDASGVRQYEAIVWSSKGYAVPTPISVLGSRFQMQTRKNGSPKFYSIHCSSLGPHIFCVPKFGHEDHHKFIRIKEMNSWSEDFFDSSHYTQASIPHDGVC